VFFDFTTLTNNTVDHLKVQENDGSELIRNIYLQVRDIAGNWSATDSSTLQVDYSKLIKTKIMIDTRSPVRPTKFKHGMATAQEATYCPNGSFACPQIWQNGTEIIRLKEIAGVINYSDDSGSTWDPAVKTRTKVTNNKEFIFSYSSPTDMSGISGVWYKLSTPPYSYADPKGTLVGSGTVTVTAGEISPDVPYNFQPIYVWLKDGSANPDSAIIAGINDYYANYDNSFYDGILTDTYEVLQNYATATRTYGSDRTEYQAGTKKCLYAADANQPSPAAQGIVNYLTHNECRVLRFELPYDGTVPVFPKLLPSNKLPRPYTFDYNTEIETTFINNPQIYFYPAEDTTQAPRESGLARGPAFSERDTYSICLGYTQGDCDLEYPYTDAAYTAPQVDIANPLIFDTPAVVPAGFPDGVYYLSARAYDRAGNYSNSEGKRIVIDTQPPCAPPLAPEACEVIIADGKFSINYHGVTVAAIAVDAATGLENLIIGEYIDEGGTCFATFWTTGGMSTKIPQPCSGNLDFTIAIDSGNANYLPTAILDYATMSELDGFQLSAGDGIKKMEAQFKDFAGRWSF